MIFAIRSRRVLLESEDGYAIRPAVISVANGYIERIELLEADEYERERTQAGPRVIELHDHLVTPAFVNTHTHLALAFLRGVASATLERHNLVEDVFFHYEHKLSPEDVRAFARMGAYESLVSGVGFVWDHYYGGTAVADALCDTSLAGVVAPTVQDLGGPGLGGAEEALSTTLEVARREGYRERGVFAALGLHATDTVSPALMRRTAELAGKHQLPLHMHLAQSFDELSRVRAREGITPVELVAREGLLDLPPRAIFAHALFASRSDLARLDPTRHAIAYCPSSQLEFGFPADIATLSSANVSWVLGTDCAASNDSMNLQKELRLAHGAASATITGSASYERFLASGRFEDAEATQQRRTERSRAFAPHATSNALLSRVWERAGTLHPGVRVGTIAVGALANILAWNTDHPAFWPEHDLTRGLAMGDTTGALHAMFVAGRRIGRIGDVTRNVMESDDYREARIEATERFTRLLAG